MDHGLGLTRQPRARSRAFRLAAAATLVLATASPVWSDSTSPSATPGSEACQFGDAALAHPCLCHALLTSKSTTGEAVRFLGQSKPFYSAPRPIRRARRSAAGPVILGVVADAGKPPGRSQPDDEHDDYLVVHPTSGATLSPRLRGAVSMPDLAADGRRLAYIDKRGVELIDLQGGQGLQGLAVRGAPRLLLPSRAHARKSWDIAIPSYSRWRDDHTLVVLVSGEAGYSWAWEVSDTGKVARGPSTVVLRRPVRGAYALADFDDHGPGHLTVVRADGTTQAFRENDDGDEPGNPSLPLFRQHGGHFNDALLAPDGARLWYESSGKFYVRRLDASAHEPPRPLGVGIASGSLSDAAWLDPTHLALLVNPPKSERPSAIWIVDVASAAGPAPIHVVERKVPLPADTERLWLPEDCPAN